MSLIVIEGLDGTGKTTQTALLEEALRRRGPLKKVSFPDYDSSSSALVKMYLNGEFGGAESVNAFAAGAFYAVDRYASFRLHWQEAYEAGVTILADRYVTSNLLYQMGKLPRERWEEYMDWVEDFEFGKLGLPRPDRVILLVVPLEVSQRLLLARYQGDAGKRDIHERDLAFLRSCADCAAFAARRLGWSVVSCVEAGELLPVEEIHRRVLAALNQE